MALQTAAKNVQQKPASPHQYQLGIHMNTLQNFGIKMLAASVTTVLGGSVMAADIHAALVIQKHGRT